MTSPSLFDITDQAFEQDYWSDLDEVRTSCARLLERDEPALRRQIERAWNVRNTKLLVAAGEVLREHERLDAASALTSAIAHLAHDRPKDALRFLSHNALKGADSPKLAYQRARAMAALGDLERAFAFLDQVGSSLHEVHAKALRALLVRAGELKARHEAAPSWETVRDLTDCLLEFDARRPAGKLIDQSLGLAPDCRKPGFNHMRAVLERGLWLGVNVANALDTIRRARKRTRHPDLDALARAYSAIGPAPPADTSAEFKARSGLGHYVQGVLDHAAGDYAAAARAFAGLSDEHRRNPEYRRRLARSIGAGVLASAPGEARRVARPGLQRPLMINALPFSDELDLLRIRLHEMADWVDHFVICEAVSTFAGEPKPLHFQENAEAFSAFRDKIIHVKVEFPEHLTTHWARDFHQRDMAWRAIREICSDQDYVLITDADEIVDRRALDGFDADFACLRMPLSRYFLNYRAARSEPPPAAAIWRARYLSRHGLSYARFFLSRGHGDWPRIRNAGWHYSSLGKAERIASKYRNYAHQERENELHSDEAVARLLRELKDGRFEPGWTRTEISRSAPAYVRENLEAFAQFIL